jgi:hypothetical protein
LSLINRQGTTAGPTAVHLRIRNSAAAVAAYNDGRIFAEDGHGGG